MGVWFPKHEKAKAFADRFRMSYRYGSYHALADDPRVDAVYIATPASEHKAGIELCLRAGKAVLCEKPLTVNRQEAEDVIILARRSGIFLMEAMWTRFLPLLDRLRELLARNVIGDIRHVMADAASQCSPLILRAECSIPNWEAGRYFKKVSICCRLRR